MKFLAIAKIDPRTTPEKLQPLMEAEARQAWELYRRGTVRELYDRPDRKGVVMILECGSAAEARGSLEELPFVREKLIDFEVIPLAPFAYLELLFRDA